MPNGDELNDQLEFEERIKAMSSDDRSIFIAKQVYNLMNKVDTIACGSISKKAVATTSGITVTTILAVVEGLKALFGR